MCGSRRPRGGSLPPILQWLLKVVTKTMGHVNGTTPIGIGPLRHRRPHGPVRSNGGRKTGANMIMMIRNGGIDINPCPGLCALRHQALNRSAWGVST